MPFSVEDFHDLVRLLDQHPEWRAELRRLVLTEELLGLPADMAELRQAVAELAEAQRRSGVELAELRQAGAADQAELRQTVAALAAEVGELRQTVAALAAEVAELRQTVAALAAEVAELAEAQLRFAAELEQLRLVVADLAHAQRETRDELGSFKGDILELRYRERASAYFDPIIRRPRLLTRQHLADLLDAAEDAGQFTEAERREVLLADVVVRGRRRSDDAEVYLVVEVSAGVGWADVDRAFRRAELLSRLRPALAAVAGERMLPDADALAEARGVWRVFDGQVLAPNGS